MTNFLPVLLGVAIFLCSLYQLVLFTRTKDIFSLVLSSSLLILFVVKAFTLSIQQDFLSNYQFILLFPVSLICIIKTFKDIKLHPFLRVFLVSFFFISASLQIPAVTSGQSSIELLKKKINKLNSENSLLNIVFHPDNPFTQEIAKAYISKRGINNTILFSVPILTDDYQRIVDFKKTYQFINIISLDSGEEKVASEVLETFLAKDYKYIEVKYERFSLSDHFFAKENSFSLRSAFYKLK